MNTNTKKLDVKRLVALAMFSALAYVIGLVTGFIKVDVFEFDIKDAIITLASFIYGPLSGIVIALVTALLQVPFSGTGWHGFVMDFASSACFSGVAGLIYKLWRKPTGAIVALASAVLTMVALMVVLNIIITPLYYGMPRDVVLNMVPVSILPFNLAKGLINAALAMLLYKPLVQAMRSANLIDGKIGYRFTKSGVLMLVASVLAIVLGAVIFVVIKAEFDFNIFRDFNNGN